MKFLLVLLYASAIFVPLIWWINRRITEGGEIVEASKEAIKEDFRKQNRGEESAYADLPSNSSENIRFPGEIHPERRKRYMAMKKIYYSIIWRSMGALTLFGISLTALSVPGSKYSLASFYYVLLVFFFLSMIKKIRPGVTAALYWLDIPIYNVSRGVYLHIPGAKVRKIRSTAMDMEIPGDPEDVHYDDKTPVPEGKVRPIRMAFGMPVSEESPTIELLDPITEEVRYVLKNSTDKNPRNQVMEQEVQIFVRFQINDAIHFIEQIGKLLDLKRAFIDQSTSTFQELMGQVTPAVVLQNKKTFSSILLIELQNTTDGRSHDHLTGNPIWHDDWAVNVLTAEVKNIVFNHDFNDAIASIGEETARATAAKIKADRQAYIDMMKGKGEGEGIELREKGLTNALVARSKRLKVNGVGVLTTDASVKIATEGEGKKTVLALTGKDGIAGSIAAAAIAAGETIMELEEDKDDG